MDKWIPVTARMPDDLDHVLVTVQEKCRQANWDRPQRYYTLITTSIYDSEEGFDCRHVLAWMPLPDPYKGGEQK